MTFKIGDQVILVDGFNMKAKPGARATVVGFSPPYITIEWIRDGLSSIQMDGRYYPSSFKLERPPTPFEDDLYSYLNEELR